MGENVKKQISEKSKIKLNKKQREVFEYSFSENKKNLLVSAAAGSGKTRVLVEKIIDMISNDDSRDKVNLSDMLIMTFTKKATYEMKSRIKVAIDKRIKSGEFNDKLVKEAATIQNANISTIDSFCKRIVEENYTELNKKDWSLYKDFDPSYRIADDNELSILYNNVLDNFLENEVYLKDKDGKYKYNRFLKCYFKKNSDKQIREMLLSGLSLLSSLAWPNDYFSMWKAKASEKADETSLNEAKEVLKTVIQKIKNDGKFENLKSIIIRVLDETLAGKKSVKDDFIKEVNSTKENLDKIESFYNYVKDKKNTIDDLLNKIIADSISTNEMRFNYKKDFKLMAKSKTGGGGNNQADYDKASKALLIGINDLVVARDKVLIEETYFNLELEENVITYLDLLEKFYILVVKEKVRKSIYAISDYANLALDILYDEGKAGDDLQVKHAVSDFTIKNIREKYKYIFVDEYQDTNSIQESLISAVSTGDNVFMVGDVKQSIYAFRNAEPKIFTEKFHNYKNTTGNGKVITMDMNYRSSYKIIDYVNELFSKCMTRDFGMIDYKEDGLLDKPTLNNDSGLEEEMISKKENFDPVDIHIVYEDKTKEVDAKNIVGSKVVAVEAKFVAEKIKELHDSGKYNYKDIVVLMRSPSSKIDAYLDAFSKFNIPCYSEMKKGFFNRVEIKLMVDILNIVDNERQDIPLANVLISDIVGLTNSELAFIKYLHKKTTNNKNAALIDDLRYFANYSKYVDDADFKNTIKKENEQKEIDVSDKEQKIINQALEFIKICKEYYKDSKKNGIDYKVIKNKIDGYFKVYENLCVKARYLGISELINEIYLVTGIKNIMAAMNDGVMRVANLDVLYETARNYENSSFVGLFNFMRYLERIKELDKDKGLAKTSDENDDVVRLMSIHTSKGLEFKCVILSNCAATYNEKDLQRSVPLQFDKDLGIALDAYDLNKKFSIETKKKLAIKDKKRKSLYEEEMRILYVALTRAQEKLIVVGSVLVKGGGYLSYSKAKKYFDAITRRKEIAKKGDEIKDNTLLNDEEKLESKDCKSYLELILNNFDVNSISCNLYMNPVSLGMTDLRREDSLILEDIISESDKDKKAENELISNDPNKTLILKRLDDDKLNESMKLDYHYSYLNKIEKVKMSVSDIKREKHDLYSKVRSIKVVSGDQNEDQGSTDDLEVKAEKNKEMVAADNGASEDNTFSTDRGNAYHRYMQFYDYNKNEFAGEKGKDADWIKMISESKIQKFLESKVGSEMATAFKTNNNNLYREYKFMRLFSQDEIKKYRLDFGIINSDDKSNDLTIKGADEHHIIIQGIIDAFYIKEEEGKKSIVLVDYKTDGLSSKNPNESKLTKDLIDMYGIQLKIYEDVLKELTGYEVTNKYIYSFALDKEIEL